jgi:hypothetical protein
MIKKSIAWFLAGIFILCSIALAAHSIAPPYEPVGEFIRVTIVGDERGPLPSYPAFRSDKYYFPSRYRVEARRGERYSVRVVNLSRERIALVISVDGLNIISGRRAYGGSNESMYVLNPGQTGNFSGWRSGMNHVQRFYFTSAADSYAGRLGQPDQLGLIRVSAFRDQRQIFARPYDASGETKADSMSRKMAESEAGTGYGESSWSPVSETEFTPEASPVQTCEIKYEWLDPVYLKSEPGSHGFAPPPPR